MRSITSRTGSRYLLCTHYVTKAGCPGLTRVPQGWNYSGLNGEPYTRRQHDAPPADASRTPGRTGGALDCAAYPRREVFAGRPPRTPIGSPARGGASSRLVETLPLAPGSGGGM